MDNKQGDELELTDEMLERLDEIDNTVYACICTLAEKPIEWDMEIIGEVTEEIRSVLEKHEIQMRWPGIVTNEDGTQEYSDN